MTANLKLRELALNVLKKRDTAWDSRGTVDKKLSQGEKLVGTAKSARNQHHDPTVPLSHALGTWTVGHALKSRTPFQSALLLAL
jgi:hypothetical protein